MDGIGSMNVPLLWAPLCGAYRLLAWAKLKSRSNLEWQPRPIYWTPGPLKTTSFIEETKQLELVLGYLVGIQYLSPLSTQ